MRNTNAGSWRTLTPTRGYSCSTTTTTTTRRRPTEIETRRGYPPAASTAVSQLPAPLPHVASASASVSPLPFAPPSRSSSHQNSKTPVHTRDLTIVSATNEHVVGQADPATRVEREDSDVEMGVVGSHHDRAKCPVRLRPDVLSMRIHTPCDRASTPFVAHPRIPSYLHPDVKNAPLPPVTIPVLPSTPT
ncbi:hypothetical protein EI94DRAFT_529466 [Lactarius quietus]|nr:hypothetical protein EI94DRAFT_529466 [Lactarius quietus]